MISAACTEVLKGTVANSFASPFDEGNGKMYLVQAQDCWDSVVAEIDAKLAETQVGLNVLKSLNLPTDDVEKAIEEFEKTKQYSDGLMLLTSWQWDETLIAKDGGQIGTCYYQKSSTAQENAAQCWAYTYNKTTKKYDSGNFYEILQSKITSTTNLSDFEAVDFSKPAGTVGTWIMTAPQVAFGTTKIVFAGKFNPKTSRSIDPIFKPGAATATTYISTRVDQTTTTPAKLFSLSEHHLGAN